MPDASDSALTRLRSDERFASTHWSVILAAARTESPQARQALEKLCAAYWYPLYAYLRRSGSSPEEAEDLTQEFFATRVINRRVLQGVDPAGGRFRSWLLTSLQNLVRNEHAKQMAKKRGGGVPHLSLNWQDAEGRYLAEPAHELTPERLYERTWALTLLERVVQLLGARYAETGRAQLFEELKPFLPGERSAGPAAGAAARLNRSEDAVKMAISRLRREYGELLTAELRRTVDDARDVEAERQHLLAILGDA
jgi:RNA polymerase sigma-70 factor (ECF subfamily)